MPHYGSLTQHRFAAEADDVRSSPVYDANHQKLGEIEDIIFDHSTGVIHYAVIATADPLPAARILLPAGHIRSFPRAGDAFSVDITRRQAASLPAYQPTLLNSEADWTTYEQQYNDAWRHLRRETIVGLGSLGEEVVEEVPRRPEDTGEVPGERDAGGLGSLGEDVAASGDTARSRRWASFEELLKRNRVDVTAKCPSCAPAKNNVA
jgi:sporulation protein YlmC with PRC-barrel domain